MVPFTKVIHTITLKGLKNITQDLADSQRKHPWRLIYAEKCIDKRTALIREKQLKRSNKEYLNGYLIKTSTLCVSLHVISPEARQVQVQAAKSLR